MERLSIGMHRQRITTDLAELFEENVAADVVLKDVPTVERVRGHQFVKMSAPNFVNIVNYFYPVG